MNMTVNGKIENAFVEAGISNEALILAVSGGSDSQVMLKAVPHVAKKFNVTCVAVGVHHGIRVEADSELDIAEDLAKSCGVKFIRVTVKVGSGASFEANARDARYAALFEEADNHNSRYVATAHHFDDRAETVFIRLLRGKNIGSLAVLPLISGRVFRPMLKVDKKNILKYCERWKIVYANDPGNENTQYLRVKIRKEIMPQLVKLNPQFTTRLNELADEALNLR